MNEQAGERAGWNWSICLPTRPEDAGKMEMELRGLGTRYLQPRHGVLRWSEELLDIDRLGQPAKQHALLEPPAGTARSLALAPDEVDAVPRYQSSNDAYVLRAGRFVTGGAFIQVKGQRTQQLPAVTMTSTGEIRRWTVSEELRGEVEKKAGVTSGTVMPYARGLLVHIDGWASKGAGLYLQNGNALRKVWCGHGASPAEDPKCGIDAWKFSPDGCKVALLPHQGHGSTVTVLDLCARP